MIVSITFGANNNLWFSLKSLEREIPKPELLNMSTGIDDENPPKPHDLDSFLVHFLANHRDDNFISIKHGNYSVQRNEIVGEVVDWTMQYLQYM